MRKYLVQNYFTGQKVSIIQASSPKEAFLSVVGYTKKEEDLGIFVEETSIGSPEAHFRVCVKEACKNTPIAYYKFVRPQMSDTFILRNKIANTYIGSKNNHCMIFKVNDGIIYYIPDYVENLKYSLRSDIKRNFETPPRNIKVIGGRSLLDCTGLFKDLGYDMSLDCLDLTDFYAPMAESWDTAFQASDIKNLVGLQRQSFINVRSVFRMFAGSRINTVNLQGKDFRNLETCEYCFVDSEIETLLLDGIQLSHLYRAQRLFSNATISNGIDLHNITLPSTQGVSYDGMFESLDTPYVDISTWSMHRTHSSYSCLFNGSRIGKLKTKPNSPFLKKYKS